MQNRSPFHLTIFISVSAKELMRKKSEDEQTFEELNSAHRHSQSECQLVQTRYI